LRGAMSQGVIGAIPHILCWVKFRGIGRKVVRVDPGTTMEKVLDQLAAMNRAAIPQQDNGTTQRMEQGLEKLYHFFPSEGAPVELDVQRHPLALGRDDHRVKGVDASLLVPHGTVGSLPLGSPGSVKVP